MTLVSYSDSESDQSDPPAKKPRLDYAPSAPDLPDAFSSLYTVTARLSSNDSSVLHSGRKRLIPHVEGNWSSHVYLEWIPTQSQHTLLDLLLLNIQQLKEDEKLQSLLKTLTSSPLPLHVSLSSTLMLKTENKDEFLKDVRLALQNVGVKCVMGVRDGGSQRVRVRIAGLGVFVNAEKTCSFLVLKVKGVEERDEELLGKMLGVCNSVARKYGCKELYTSCHSIEEEGDVAKSLKGEKTVIKGMQESEKDKVVHWQFHISIAWSLNINLTIEDLSQDGESNEVNTILDQITEMEIDFSDVKIKIGKEVHSLPFIQSRKTSQSILR